VLWATRGHLHLDRVATAWLVLRFVDPDATFVYVEGPGDVPAGATAFGMPGVELSGHDAAGTTFAKVLRRYELDDPALPLVERMVAEGVRHALRHDSADTDPEARAIGVALDGIGIGMGVLYDDDALLRASLPLYDALYVLGQALTLPPAQREAMPPGPPAARSAFLRERVRRPTP
jgi:hypothetical protein